MLPLFHDFEGRSVVVVGGGSVALRKTRYFAPEADVTVVAPEFVDGFENLECTLQQRALAPGEAGDVVDGVALVVPATDDRELNDAITDAAREAGCLVNRVDEPGDTVTPSRVESAQVTVAISTHGASPATTKYLRQRIEAELERADPMVALQSELRDALRSAVAFPPAKRRDALWRVLEDETVWECLEAGREADARTRAWEIVDDLE
ncbi:precorrin-2 dehydrogenase/sirohydrochlorin ferrochelatase family protein [Natronobacterium gregoryi]|uniref:precorrin-2 dehydrogenase n=2 Tax=Natronobacterium gregoryi TaxID=44930 RepID=L0ABU6_NATGS|nr:bifunctional precorrin-2 dehydrogenase/sirohydrochlorin ferrochelatase [Natronobacterium gregoryi]AFZ71368.1 siroheme synthase, N-terminal domain protein [Natronobacterium gregoryi SP2]ELY66891.1 siroheme synthase [Natronobacterium gregoryi SP2]PLK21252.1 bifunctional precorrin-2 dehydrogenase/sirohydrochlorin ferrochelatase [Natronobacterium gregoryi SP2]SFI85277.1 precorrin-2 dehydrogenase / sirohydrochlorin ferrochelatase [Natronobacterium gregoryi]